MNIRSSFLQSLPRGKKLVLAVSLALVVLGTPSVFALSTLDAGESVKRVARTTEADEPAQRSSPVTDEVDEPENQTPAAAEQRASEQTTPAASQPATVQTQGTETTEAPAPAPAPQPVEQPPVSAPQPAPAPSNRIVTAVTEERQFDRYGAQIAWTCIYTVSAGRTIVAIQPGVCTPVGSEIGEDLAITNGLGL